VEIPENMVATGQGLSLPGDSLLNVEKFTKN